MQQSGRSEKATEIYREYLLTQSLTKKNCHIYALYALSLVGIGAVLEAIEILDEIIKFEPQELNYRLTRGELLMKIKEPERALGDFRVAFIWDKKNPETCRLMVQACQILQLWEEGHQYYRIAIDASKEDLKFLDIFSDYIDFLADWTAYSRTKGLDREGSSIKEGIEAIVNVVSEWLTNTDTETFNRMIPYKARLTQKARLLVDTINRLDKSPQFYKKIEEKTRLLPQIELNRLLDKTIDPGDIGKIVSITFHGRSGSILLGTMLDSHSRVLHSAENVFFRVVYSTEWQHSELPSKYIFDFWVTEVADKLTDPTSPDYLFHGIIEAKEKQILRFTVLLVELAKKYRENQNKRGTLFCLCFIFGIKEEKHNKIICRGNH